MAMVTNKVVKTNRKNWFIKQILLRHPKGLEIKWPTVAALSLKKKK